jgi:hypothetical protein
MIRERQKREREAATKERPEKRLVPWLFAENLPALRGMAFRRARMIVENET